MIYMKHGTNKGSATAKGYEGYSTIRHFEIEANRSFVHPTGTSREIGSLQMSVVKIKKLIDAYPGFKVMQDITNPADLIIANDAPGKTLEITLSDAILTHWSVSHEGTNTYEYLEFGYTRVEYKKIPVDAKGKAGTAHSCSYDLGQKVWG